MTSMWLPPTIVDLTDKSPKSYRLRTRKSARIDAIVLHQTAFSRGNNPALYHEVHAHFVVLPDGRALHLHPVDAYIIASSAFNEDSISIEIVGNFRAANGRYWRGETYGQHMLSDAQIAGARDLVKHLQMSYGLSFIFAHRQGEAPDSRGNCPGPDIWYNVGEWAISNLGMSDGGKGYTEGNGGAIPDAWRAPLKVK